MEIRHLTERTQAQQHKQFIRTAAEEGRYRLLIQYAREHTEPENASCIINLVSGNSVSLEDIFTATYAGPFTGADQQIVGAIPRISEGLKSALQHTIIDITIATRQFFEMLAKGDLSWLLFVLYKGRHSLCTLVPPVMNLPMRIGEIEELYCIWMLALGYPSVEGYEASLHPWYSVEQPRAYAGLPLRQVLSIFPIKQDGEYYMIDWTI